MTENLKQYRRDSLVNCAVEYLNKYDLTSLTIRKLASEYGFSVGHIHNHFSSIEELKAEALKKMTAAVLSLLSALDYTSYRHFLERFLFIEQNQYPHYPALLREYRVQSNFSSIIREAYNESMLLVHRDLSNIIISGSKSGEFMNYNSETVAKKAWKIIAFVQGLDSLMGIRLIKDDALIAIDYVREILESELPHP